MFSWIIAFALGGYLVPALYFFILTFEHDRKAEDHPTVFDSLTTGILSGLMWPIVNRVQDQGDTVHWQGVRTCGHDGALIDLNSQSVASLHQ